MGDVSKIALDFVDQVSDLDDESEVRELLLRYGRNFGFDYLIVAELPVRGMPQVHLSNWPREYFDYYCKYLYHDDPLARHARRTTEPFVWSEVQWDQSKGSPAQRVMDQTREAGLSDGFVVPILGARGDQSVIGLSGRRPVLNGPDRHAMHLMCVYAHHAIRSLRQDGSRACAREATEIERTVLAHRFLARDCSMMSALLGLSKVAIERVVTDVYRRFGATDVLQAACKARLAGVIDL